jgi:hypothetical protein
MKNKRIIVSIFLTIATISSFAQKVDIDKEKYSVKRTYLPTQPVSNDIYFYQVDVSLPVSVSKYIKPEQVASNFNIEGFKQAQGQPNSIKITYNTNDFYISRNEITSRTEDIKDKDGKVTGKRTLYKNKVSYTFGSNYGVKAPDGSDIIKMTNYNNQDVKVYESNEFSTSKEAANSWNDNADAQKSKLINDFINNNVDGISRYLRNQFGYTKQTISSYLWTLDSKKHAENEKFQAMTKLVIEKLKSLTYEKRPEDLEASLKPAIDYFVTISKGDMSDKNNKKLVYAAVYNLSEIYYYLDEPVQSKIYAERLINDDLDKRDGKEAVKNADDLLEKFKINKTASTHFERVFPEIDQSLVPVVASSSASTMAAEAPKTPRFLEGMVITLDDKEIEGVFINEFEKSPWEVQDGIRFIPMTLFNDGKYDKKSLTKYSPKELKGLAIAGKLFVPVLFSDISKLANGSPLGATTKKYFLEVQKDGKYKLLKYYESPANLTAFSGGNSTGPKVENLGTMDLILVPGEDKAKKVTTSYLEELITPNASLFADYQKGKYSKDGKAINVKRGMLDRMAAKTDLDENIDLNAIIDVLNK